MPTLQNRRRVAALSVAALLAASAMLSPARAVMPIVSEASAREVAVKTLLGAPYGRTPAEVEKILSAGRFAQPSEKPICAENGAAAWVFSVSTTYEGQPLKGTIQIKAANGAFDCANLPFLS